MLYQEWAIAIPLGQRASSKHVAWNRFKCSFQMWKLQKWPLALDEAQYIVAKTFLGCPKTAHLGSHVVVLAETRFLTRAGTWLAKSIIMARARLACLPDIPQAIQRAGIPDTWLHHSASLLRHFQIGWDLWDSTFSIPSEVFVSVKARRHFLRQYAKHVQPFLLSSDYEWFKDALAVLNSEGLMTSSHCTNHGPLKNNGTPGQYHFGKRTASRVWLELLGAPPIISDASGGFTFAITAPLVYNTWWPLVLEQLILGEIFLILTLTPGFCLRQRWLTQATRRI